MMKQALWIRWQTDFDILDFCVVFQEPAQMIADVACNTM